MLGENNMKNYKLCFEPKWYKFLHYFWACLERILPPQIILFGLIMIFDELLDIDSMFNNADYISFFVSSFGLVIVWYILMLLVLITSLLFVAKFIARDNKITIFDDTFVISTFSTKIFHIKKVFGVKYKDVASVSVIDNKVELKKCDYIFGRGTNGVKIEQKNGTNIVVFTTNIEDFILEIQNKCSLSKNADI